MPRGACLSPKASAAGAETPPLPTSVYLPVKTWLNSKLSTNGKSVMTEIENQEMAAALHVPLKPCIPAPTDLMDSTSA